MGFLTLIVAEQAGRFAHPRRRPECRPHLARRVHLGVRKSQRPRLGPVALHERGRDPALATRRLGDGRRPCRRRTWRRPSRILRRPSRCAQPPQTPQPYLVARVQQGSGRTRIRTAATTPLSPPARYRGAADPGGARPARCGCPVVLTHPPGATSSVVSAPAIPAHPLLHDRPCCVRRRTPPPLRHRSRLPVNASRVEPTVHNTRTTRFIKRYPCGHGDRVTIHAPDGAGDPYVSSSSQAAGLVGEEPIREEPAHTLPGRSGAVDPREPARTQSAEQGQGDRTPRPTVFRL